MSYINKQPTFKLDYIVMFLFFFTIFSGASQNSSKDLSINIVTSFDGESIEEDKWYVTKNNDSIQITKLRFYLTNFVVQTEDKKNDSIFNSNYLIDAFNKETLKIILSNTNYNKEDKLLLSIGVSEHLNTSGANSGDLDPSKGMFWSWQSGYINFKMEGKSPSCKTRKNKFQFHIGGYQKPFETLRSLTFKLSAIKNNELTINVDIAQFFDALQLSSQNQIMIPGKEANDAADRLPQLFSIDE